MKSITAQIMFSLVLSVTAHAQGRAVTKVNLSEPFWLNYSLIFFKGCRPKVSPDNITFTEGNCLADAYSGEIFSRGTKVKIYSVSEGEGFARVRFRYWPEKYELESEWEILLKNDSDKAFRESFGLLFSERKVPEEYACPDKLTTRKDVIQCLGFPIRVTKEGDVENYFYILEFVGPNPFQSFDGFWVEIKDGKFKDVSGYI